METSSSFIQASDPQGYPQVGVQVKSSGSGSPDRPPRPSPPWRSEGRRMQECCDSSISESKCPQRLFSEDTLPQHVHSENRRVGHLGKMRLELLSGFQGPGRVSQHIPQRGLPSQLTRDKSSNRGWLSYYPLESSCNSSTN